MSTPSNPGPGNPPPRRPGDIGPGNPPPRHPYDIGPGNPPPRRPGDVGPGNPPPRRSYDIGPGDTSAPQLAPGAWSTMYVEYLRKTKDSNASIDRNVRILGEDPESAKWKNHKETTNAWIWDVIVKKHPK
jgi:hypothetical protein